VHISIVSRLLAGFALFVVFSSGAVAGPREDALEVVTKWNKAFSESDLDGIVKLYASDALFFGTGSKTLYTQPEEVRKYFERSFSRGDRVERKLDSSVMVLSETVVTVAGLETVTRTRDGKASTATGRVTFVIAKRGSEWQITHFHRSRVPQ
jgi:uncharacterized protein (TIGR02246 family)